METESGGTWNWWILDMSRKSKAKYEMKGHSIPGIKGFKDTTLEDGRAASSAFQMQSPLHVETNSNVTLDTSDPTKDLDLSGGMDKSLTKSNKESSAQYLFRQKMLFDQRKKDREKEKAKSSVEKMDDQTTEYDGTTDLKEGQQGPQPETDQDGDGILDSEQVDVMKDNNPNDGINAPDYMINKSGKDMSNEVLQESHDNKVQNLINKAQSGKSTREGSGAFMDIKKIYPEKSNEEITAMIERGTI